MDIPLPPNAVIFPPYAGQPERTFVRMWNAGHGGKEIIRLQIPPLRGQLAFCLQNRSLGPALPGPNELTPH